MNNYQQLISRLDAFTRKYYTNQLVRGGLVFLISLLLFVLTVSIGEYYLYMPVWLKMTLLSFFIIAGSTALIVWVVLPLIKMYRLGKVISHEKAAVIIGAHFPEVSDKLLNILQLKNESVTQSSKDLIEASIDQKAAQIAVVPIGSAIDISKNKRYLPYLLPLILIGVFILVAAPSIFRDASERLLHPTTEFAKPAPFRFVLADNTLQVVRNTDYLLEVTTEGDVAPEMMFLDIDGERVPMSKEKGVFSYTFRNVSAPQTFNLYAGGFYSTVYDLKVVQKPLLKSFTVSLDYPSYTGKQDEVRNSLGDISVPEGTVVTWDIATEFTDEVSMQFGAEEIVKLQESGGRYNNSARFLKDSTYALVLKNNNSSLVDTYKYTVTVVKDQHPVVQLQEFKDSISGTQIVMKGTAGDDYAISKVLFNYEVADAQNKQLNKKSIPLNISKGALTSYQHYFDIKTLDLQPGQKVSYYIEAWDNDQINGSKATRSDARTFKMFNAKEIDSAINEHAKQINSDLSSSSEQSEALKQEYKELQNKLLQNNSMGWEMQQSMKNLMKMQQQLQSRMDAVKKRFEEQVEQSKQKQYSEDLRNKQEQLEKQMDNLLDKELKEQMKKLEDLMKKLNKENAVQSMQELEQENKLFDMDLERMQELMKQMEMQMRLEDMANKVDELAAKELALKEKTDNAKDEEALKTLTEEQKKIEKDVEDVLKEDMKEAKELNEQLEKQQQLETPTEQGEQAQEEMKSSEQELNKSEKSKASKSQSKAAENLKKMASTLRQQASGMDIEQIEVDIKAVRQVLSNLMRLSFKQEQLMEQVRSTQVISKQYVANKQEQKKLHTNSLMIRDSLFALSKRIEFLSAAINRETTSLEKNMNRSVALLEDRDVSKAVSRQQYVMTHVNNLALMLNETLSNLMQMQSQASQGSSGSCKKPGGKTPKPGMGKQLSDVITKQKDLGNAMQQMQQAKQKGKGGQQGQSGSPKSGQQGEQGEEGNSEKEGMTAEKLARLAQQQSAIRKQLQELNMLLNSNGMGAEVNELRELEKQMDRTEAELVNKRLTAQLLMRQKEILSRLLKVEESVREQEQDDKRSSKSAEKQARPVPDDLKQYIDKSKSILEEYKVAPPQLKPYYKSMVEEYYKILGT
ncbi:MAG: DUF4175 family protein [Flavipsychrobacter sp.]